MEGLPPDPLRLPEASPTKARRASGRDVPLVVELRDLIRRRVEVLQGRPDARLFIGPRGGAITTTVLRDATHWDGVVKELGYEYLCRYGLRHTAWPGLAWPGLDGGRRGPVHVLRMIVGHGSISTSKSGVWRIPKRLDLNRLPASQRYKRHDRRWKRYEKQLPGHRVQIDVKFIEPLPAATTATTTAAVTSGEPVRASRRRYYQYTAIDDCTRLRVLKIYPANNQKTAIQFLDYVLSRLPFGVEVIQTDNGAEFQSGFHWHVLDRGIQHVYIKPRTRGSTARWSAPTASMPKSSTDCSTACRSTTHSCSATSSKSGRTTTTTTDHTAVSAARPPMRGSARRPPRPKTSCSRSTSAAQPSSGRSTTHKSLSAGMFLMSRRLSPH